MDVLPPGELCQGVWYSGRVILRVLGLPSIFCSPLLLDAVSPFLVMSRSYMHGTLMEPKKQKDIALNVECSPGHRIRGWC